MLLPCLLLFSPLVFSSSIVKRKIEDVAVQQMTAKIDPDSQEDYWDSIKDTKIVNSIAFKGEENTVNDPPIGPHLKVVCISDTHEQLRDLMPNIPNGDVLVHTGDFTNHGDLDKIKEFDKLLGTLPHKHKLFIAGNHELGFDSQENLTARDPKWAGARGRGTPNGQSLIQNGTYLQDQSYEISGVKFYGAPWHPLRGYPFYKARGAELKNVWAKIPNDTDVLLSHSPALGYLDLFGTERWGCRDLLERIESFKPKFHVFGHVHERYGVVTNNITTFINAAQCSKKNKLQNQPVVFYISLPKTL